MRRMVAKLHDHPDIIYTVSITKEQVESLSEKKYPRNTYFVYYRRLCKMGIAESVKTDNSDEPAFRCASVFKAKSYLEGHYQDYTPGMAPTDPPIRPADSVLHRSVYRLQLSNAELEVVRNVGVWERFGRSPGYYRVNNKAFSLRAWSSGKARIFLKDDWREGLARLFDIDLIQRIEDQIKVGAGEAGWARHPPITSGKLPTGNLCRVVNPEGKVTIFQYGYSQIPSGELDRHGPENDAYADMVEKWLFDDMKCKTDLATRLASLDRTLGNLPDMIGKAVAEAVRKAIESMNNQKPDEQPYEKRELDPHDHSYG